MIGDWNVIDDGNLWTELVHHILNSASVSHALSDTTRSEKQVQPASARTGRLLFRALDQSSASASDGRSLGVEHSPKDLVPPSGEKIGREHWACY